MADPLQELRERLQRESAEADKQLLHSIRQQSTEDGRSAEWDRWRGKTARPTADRRAWRREFTELWMAMPPGLVPQLVVFAACILLFVMTYSATLSSGRRIFHSRGIVAGGLPSTLKVNVRKGQSSLHYVGGSLSARLNSPRRGAQGDVSVFDVDYSGTDAQGNLVTFKGSMLVTNVFGAAKLRSSDDIAGILLDGELRVGNQPPTTIRQSYVR